MGHGPALFINSYIQRYFPNAKYLDQENIEITGMIIIILYMSLFFFIDVYSCW